MKHSELNILIEYINFVNKFGEKKIEKLLSVIKDADKLNILINCLEEAQKLAKTEHTSNDINPISEKNRMRYDKIFSFLTDKSKFKNTNQLLRFFSTYNFNSKSKSKREDKVREFLYFADRTLNISFDILLDDVMKLYKLTLIEQDVNQNDLANWSELIIRKNDLT
jgi:hypothetical protein